MEEEEEDNAHVYYVLVMCNTDILSHIRTCISSTMSPTMQVCYKVQVFWGFLAFLQLLYRSMKKNLIR